MSSNYNKARKHFVALEGQKIVSALLWMVIYACITLWQVETVTIDIKTNVLNV